MWKEAEEAKDADRAAASEEAKGRLGLERDKFDLEKKKYEEGQKAKTARAEQLLLATRTASFEAFRKAGFSSKEALQLAGLQMPE